MSDICHHYDIAHECLDFASFAINTNSLNISWEFCQLVDSILGRGGLVPELVDYNCCSSLDTVLHYSVQEGLLKAF